MRIAIEFLQNLQEGKNRVNGRTIPVIEEIIIEVSGIPMQGERWAEKHLLLREAVTIYQDSDEPLERKNRGINPTSLHQPWQ